MRNCLTVHFLIVAALLVPSSFSVAATLAAGADSSASASTSSGASVSAKSDLYIKDHHGSVEEHEFRQGQMATHIYLDWTDDPYLFFAFPAGNSGVSVWFKNLGKSAALNVVGQPHRVDREKGLHGAEVEVVSSAEQLILTDSVLGSMRFIRDRELNVKTPTEVELATRTISTDQTIKIARTSFNGLADYLIEIESLGDTRFSHLDDGIHLTSTTGVHFKIRGFSSEDVLTPLAPEDVFKPEALTKMPPDKVREFSFLLYKEKLLAGSPRYLSRFGRDSNITLNILMDAMKPEAIEGILGATLAGSHPTGGWVSHEQTEGDFASWERMKNKHPYLGIKAPTEDYKMIDDAFIFTINLAAYMSQYPERVKPFLDKSDARGLSYRQLVQNNFDYVSRATKAFSDHPSFQNLVHLKQGQTVGQWRDSDNGLGGGIYPFDVNAALVPGALQGLHRVYSTKESEFYDLKRAAEFEKAFHVWSTQVVPLFEVKIPAKVAQAKAQEYFRDLKIDSSYLPKPPAGDLTFPALSLNALGQPIAIMHSDDTMMLAFGSPAVQFLGGVTERIERDFPYGLHTPVGMLVANPTFVGRDLQDKFTEVKYHGRTAWGMQEDLYVIGLERQLQRSTSASGLKEELQMKLNQQLSQSRETVLRTITAKSSMTGAEVFSILFKDGKYVAVPFDGDAKSNVNQLWSHLRIADH